jgi:hypothetical protein
MSVFVLSCLHVAALDYETEEEARAQQRAVELLMNERKRRSDGISMTLNQRKMKYFSVKKRMIFAREYGYFRIYA